MTTPMKAVPRAGEADRDAQGYPEGLRNTGEPRAPVNTSTITSDHPITARVDQSNSGNINHHLPWLVLTAILAGAAFFGVVVIMWKGPQYMEAVAKAGSAKAEAIAELARSDASVAKDYVDQDKSRIKAELKAQMEKQK